MKSTQRTESRTIVESSELTWPELMARGRFEEAWRLSDEAVAAGPIQDASRPRHEQVVWDGSSLSGKHVLVRCYHGLGDTIQFARYLALVRRVASRVDVWAPESVIPLLETTGAVDACWSLHDGVIEHPFEIDVEIMELAHVFRSSLLTIPSDVPYLFPAPSDAIAPAAALEPELGLTWRAGGWDPRRSVPFDALEALFDVPGARFTALQETLIGTEPSRFPAWRARSLSGLAAHVASLGLVITVDSMVAHLAGALGRPVWLLLHSSPDWRWMRDRRDSPWYPTMTIYRQQVAGRWSEVFEAVRADLADWIAARTTRPDTHAP